MLVMLSGRMTFARLEHAVNATSAMLVTPLEIVTLVKLLHLSKATVWMQATLPGIVTLTRAEQPSNEHLPRLVTVPGMVTLTRTPLLRNAPHRMLLTGRPLMLVGMSTLPLVPL